MAFEHLDNPEKQIKEISRVLSRKGILIFHTPNIYGYSTIIARMVPDTIKESLIYTLQGRKEEDIFPTYYRINSPLAINNIAHSSGLKIKKLKLICSTAQIIIFPPITIFELFWIRFLMSRLGKSLRTNIIAILEKL